MTPCYVPEANTPEAKNDHGHSRPFHQLVSLVIIDACSPKAVVIYTPICFPP